MDDRIIKLQGELSRISEQLEQFHHDRSGVERLKQDLQAVLETLNELNVPFEEPAR